MFREQEQQVRAHRQEARLIHGTEGSPAWTEPRSVDPATERGPSHGAGDEGREGREQRAPVCAVQDLLFHLSPGEAVARLWEHTATL